MSLIQAARKLTLQTPLGPDALVMTGFRGHEALSQLFHFVLNMISDDNVIEPNDLVGQIVTFGVKLADDSPRLFNGYVSRFCAGDEDDKGRRNYSAEVVPWLWFLTRTSDCRIFQNKAVPAIIEQIFADLSFSDYKLRIKGNHPEREFVVQYRETDFDFVSRLMEEEGIFYFFEQENGKHTLVLADHGGAYFDCRESEVDYPRDFGTCAQVDHVTSWEHRYEFRSGKTARTDYNFKTPGTDLMNHSTTVLDTPGSGKYELYDYPGIYLNNGDGRAITDVRMEAEEVEHDVVKGTSRCKTFSPGGKFTINRHQVGSEQGKTYVLASVKHSATEPFGYETGAPHGEDYENTFTCIPESVVFRPSRHTTKPLVNGLQTGVVVGPAGEEIFCDEYGRVKIQFHWDREGKHDESSSCWIRCMQAAAGKLWGNVFIPRIGQEVVVEFLEGDPDRPLITGLVYNADQMPHYELPAEKTKSYIKTNSSPGGDGFNEIRFEDGKDREQIFVHSQRNMDMRVLNDSLERVINDRHLIVGTEEDGKKGDQFEMVYRDKHAKIHRHHREHIGGNMELMVGGIDGPGDQDIVIKANKKELIEADNHLHVKGDRHEKTDGTQSLTVGQDQQEKVGNNHALEAGQEIHLKAGSKVIIEAGMQLSLVGPGGFIDIGPAGVTIDGVLVKINSGGAAGMGSGSNPTEPEDAGEAQPTEPSEADNSKTGQKSAAD